VKRAFDLAWTGASLLVLWPVLLLCAAAVYLDDGWPVFYVQERVGRDGRPFPFFKFRTMVRNAEKIGAGYEIEEKDPRITRTGHFLRRWSLDELPQLFNILRGEMSVVGPRPTLAYQVATYTPHQRRRLEVRPGLTGLAQVTGRNRLPWPERIELDIKYIDNYTPWLDLALIARTFGILKDSGSVYGEGWARRPGDPGYPQNRTEERQ
jgi:lipopolysaccharide/colanic/teichoic acid biosynthesis glycosyltransferase